MNSLILELKNEIYQPKTRISTLLRKAFSLLKKTKNQEMEDWLQSELIGYTKSEVIPEYRRVEGVLRGWDSIHVLIPDKNIENILIKRKLKQSISELKDLIKKEVKIIIPLFAMSQEEYYNIKLVG